MEANLFQVFIKLQSDLIIRVIIIRRLNFKTKFKIEIEPKSSIINIWIILIIIKNATSRLSIGAPAIAITEL